MSLQRLKVVNPRVLAVRVGIRMGVRVSGCAGVRVCGRTGVLVTGCFSLFILVSTTRGKVQIHIGHSTFHVQIPSQPCGNFSGFVWNTRPKWKDPKWSGCTRKCPGRVDPLSGSVQNTCYARRTTR